MENLKEIESFEVKKSKTELPIPVVNGVHIHSAYDPIKEAKKMIKKDLSDFQRKKKVLIFGFGFGYHVREIVSFFNEKKIKDFKIVVIEKNKKLLDNALSFFPNNPEKTKIYCQEEPGKIFMDKDFLDFLIDKPVIFAHPPSFSLYSSYFEKILKYKSPNSLSNLKTFIEDKDLKYYLEKYHDQKDLNELLENINSKKSFKDENDFLMSAFYHLSKKPNKNAGVEYE